MYPDDKEQLEDSVVLFYDGHHSRSIRLKVIATAKHLTLTENKVLRILERHARVIPMKCLICNQKMPIHARCPDCSILLHHHEPHCIPTCIGPYKIDND